jgi:hypothetical protein
MRKDRQELQINRQLRRRPMLDQIRPHGLELRRSAFKEAIAHLGKAIEMTEAAAGTADKANAGGRLTFRFPMATR